MLHPQTSPSVHLIIAADDSKAELQRELAAAFQAGTQELQPGLFAVEASAMPHARLPYLAFARQCLPFAIPVKAASIRAFAAAVVDAIAGVLPDHQPWSLHVFAFKEVLATTRMGARAWHSRSLNQKPPLERPTEASRPSVGANRCRLIGEAVVELLQRRRRHLLHYLRPSPGAFGTTEALVQLVLTSPEDGFLSVALAPLPLEQRHVVSCFPGGIVPPTVDKQAPSRAFGKLLEAEARMGRHLSARETCVDLGAAPGGWTYVAAKRGARVTAVDRSELRADLLQLKNVRFEPGDAFRFEPQKPVDWMICDVIAAAERSAELLRRWLTQGWCRHFVVTLKLDDSGSQELLEQLKRELPSLAQELWLMRLCANKKEVCAFGSRSLPEAP